MHIPRGFRKLLVVGCLLFGSTLFSSDFDESPPEDIAQELLGMKLGELCSVYRSPIDVFGKPSSPFRVSEKVAEARKEAAPDYTQTFNSFFVPSDRVFHLRLQLQRAFAKVQSTGFLLRETRTPNLYIIDQKKYCSETSWARVEQEAAGLPKSSKQQMFDSLAAKCMDESYGRANPFANDVIFSDQLVFGQSELALEFAYYHELCHIQYPGIQNSYFEEVFCDAVAVHWMRKLKSAPEMQTLPQHVRRVLKPKNPFSDILVLRSQLPELCKLKN